MFTVFAEQEERLQPVASMLERCFTLSVEAPAPLPLVYEVIA
jgi:hypothetical protein